MEVKCWSCEEVVAVPDGSNATEIYIKTGYSKAEDGSFICEECREAEPEEDEEEDDEE